MVSSLLFNPEVSGGAVGYLNKLEELEVPGSKKLLERIEKGKLKSLFSRK
ncbi:unnamed protein product [Brassica napus]|uniref:(rape) hypothetical protein n=1 Tax=Brassica napus TaxID=3708 RepID=A0A816I5L4_BRANA|nr:unnamed protein product [Brassica napus]